MEGVWIKKAQKSRRYEIKNKNTLLFVTDRCTFKDRRIHGHSAAERKTEALRNKPTRWDPFPCKNRRREPVSEHGKIKTKKDQLMTRNFSSMRLEQLPCFSRYVIVFLTWSGVILILSRAKDIFPSEWCLKLRPTLTAISNPFFLQPLIIGNVKSFLKYTKRQG